MGEFGGVEMTYLKKIFEAVKFLNSMEKQNKKIMITFHNKKVHFYELEEITESSSGTVEAKAKMLSLWGKIKL